MTMPDPQQLDLERLLFRYSMALERGDFETVASILELATDNPRLNRMIQELDAAYTTDIEIDTQIVGETTMAQLTRPLILPQKQKHAARSQRTSLLFPFAAVVAVALVGFSLLSFNPQPSFQQQVPPVNTGRESATPTPVPFEPSLVPTLIPGTANGTYTPTPLIPGVGEPMTFATIVPTVPPHDAATLQSGMPSVIVPIYCEGVTRSRTELFTRPFVDGKRPLLIGLYEQSILVPINDVASDENTGEIWYYVGIGDGDSVVNPGAQGWTSSANIELMWNCSEELGLLGAISAQTVPATLLPSTATPFPMEVVPLAASATPFPGTFDATPGPTPIGR
jgi:hypothetical protein